MEDEDFMAINGVHTLTVFVVFKRYSVRLNVQLAGFLVIKTRLTG